MRFFNFIFGILCVVCGGVFMANPAGNYVIYSYISVIAMGIFGIGSIISYLINKKKFVNSQFEAAVGTFGLILGIFGVVFMVITLIKPEFLIYVKMISIVIMMCFVVFEGISMLVNAIRNTNQINTGLRVLYGILGVLMAASAIAALCQGVGIVTILAFATFGILMGFGLIMSGLGMIFSAFR